MNNSFYTAGVGASNFQSGLDVLSNNYANINTVGYKSRNLVFADLVYTQMAGAQGGNLQQGHSMRLDKTNIEFAEPGGYNTTNRDLDFAISGDGFFGLLNPATDEITYTRDGGFQLSNLDGTFYLTDSVGRQVLDLDGSPIEMKVMEEDGGDLELDKTQVEDLVNTLGIYKVPIKSILSAVGDNGFSVGETDMEVAAQEVEFEQEDASDRSTILAGTLELSNVNFAKNMAKVIEVQRSFQYALKMIQTSDEIEQVVNDLRR